MKGSGNPFQEILVLHRQPYKENHLILEVFCKERGRIGMIAKGARRARSPWRCLLHPFIPLLVQCQGSTDLLTLLSAEARGPGYQLRDKALLCGLYANEVLVHLLQRADPHPDIFDAYHSLMTHLSALSDIEKNLRLFEKRLLVSLGFGLSLDHNHSTFEKVTADNNYYFTLEHGPVLASTETSHGNIFKGKSLLSLHHEILEDVDSLRDAKRLMRQVIDKLLDYRPLKVRELFVS